MKLHLKNILYLPLLFSFLPAFVCYLPGLPVIPYFYVITYSLIVVLIVIKGKGYFSSIKSLCLQTPLKYFVIFIICSSINSLLIAFHDSTTSISGTILIIFLKLILVNFAVFGYLLYWGTKLINYEKFAKIFILLFWVNLIIGFIAYLGQIYDITIINNIFDFLASARLKIQQVYGTNIYSQSSNYTAYGFPRLDNLFEEPSFYARFLFVFLPMVYSISEYKHKLYENKYLNYLLRKTIVPFTWVSLILTQSPIYLVFFLLITALYYRKKIIKLIKKYYLFIFTLLILLICIIKNIDLSNTFLSRIINTIEALKSSESLKMIIFIEPSLGSRFANFYNTLCIFFQHPFTGVGIANVEKYQFIQTLNSNMYLTPEIERNLRLAVFNNYKMPMNTALIYHTLAANGLIIFSIFIYFHMKIFLELNNLQKYKINPFINTNLQALKWCWISVTILMFYHVVLQHLELLLVYVLSIALIYSIKFSYINKIIVGGKDG